MSNKNSKNRSGQSGNPARRAAESGASVPTRVTPPPVLPTREDLKRKEKARDTLDVILDDALAVMVDDAEIDLTTAITMGAPAETVTARTEAFHRAKARAKDSTITIYMEALGRRRYRELEELHPATPEQDAEHRENSKDPDDPNSEGIEAPFNPDSFAPALMAETIMAPKMTADEWAEYTDDWNENEYLRLWMAVIAVNARSRVGHWGKG